MTLRKKVVEVWRKRVTEEDRDTKAPHRRPEVSQRLCNALPCPQTRSSQQRQRTFVFAPVGPIQFNSIRMILEIGDSGTFNTFRDNDDICPLCCWQLILISNLLVADFLSQFLLKIFTHVVTNTHFTYSNITFTMPCYTIWHFFQNIPSNFFPHLAHFNRALHIFTVWISHPREMILVSAKYFCRALSQFCQIILPDAPLTTTRRLDYQLFSLSLYVISDRLLLVWRLQKMQLTKQPNHCASEHISDQWPDHHQSEADCQIERGLKPPGATTAAPAFSPALELFALRGQQRRCQQQRNCVTSAADEKMVICGNKKNSLKHIFDHNSLVQKKM